MTASADSSIPTKVLSTDHTFFVFLYFFPFIIDNCRNFAKNDIKIKIFFTIIDPRINMLLGQFCLGNNLPTHIRENTDFPWQKPWQLPSAQANFKGCKILSLFDNPKLPSNPYIKSVILDIKFHNI